MRRASTIGCLVLAATLWAAPGVADSQRPARVVSLDYCADQYVLALADREQIAALSTAATSGYAYFAEQARGLPQTRATAEDVVMLDPDLVVRHWGGGYRSGEMIERFGVPVAQIDFGATIDTARANLRTVGRALGHVERADAVVRELDRRLAAVRASWHAVPEDARPVAAYVTPSGITTGADTFVHEVLEAAGLRNLAAGDGRSGWHPLDLERLVLGPPDAVVAGFYDLKSNHTNNWTIARHATLRRMLDDTPTAFVPSRLLACSAWVFVEAVEMVHRQLGPRQTVALDGGLDGGPGR